MSSLHPLKKNSHLSVTPKERKDNTRHGRISTYYPGRNFGFVVEDSTGQTWFFHKSSILSASLLRALREGEVRQDITFSGSTEVKSGKYPLADNVELISEEAAIQKDATKRASLKVRLQRFLKIEVSLLKQWRQNSLII